LQNKNRYVFSDFNSNVSQPLTNATIDIDIYAKPVNYMSDDQKYAEQNTKIRFYLMIAGTQTAKHIFRDLSENPLEIDQLGIDYIVSKYISDMAYFKLIDFSKKWDKTDFG
jgi:hypothetical protein